MANSQCSGGVRFEPRLAGWSGWPGLAGRGDIPFDPTPATRQAPTGLKAASRNNSYGQNRSCRSDRKPPRLQETGCARFQERASNLRTSCVRTDGQSRYVREVHSPGRRDTRYSWKRAGGGGPRKESRRRSEEHTSELQSPCNLVCRLLLEKKKKKQQREKAIEKKRTGKKKE